MSAAVPEDARALQLLMTNTALRVCEADCCQGGGEVARSPILDESTRVAMAYGRLVGAYRLHIRNAGSMHGGELPLFVVAGRSDYHDIGRAIMRHVVTSAVERGIDEIQVAVTPPDHHFFLSCGAQLQSIEGPDLWAGTGPWIRMSLQVAHFENAAP